MKLVSVIIPVYNRFEVLKRTLESVFAQTYPNWEIIIIDDGSKEVLDLQKWSISSSQFEKCKVLRNEPNMGPGLSRQRGIDHARGEYLCFLDADDFWGDSFLEKSIQLHENNPQIAATYCIVEEFWPSGNRIRLNSDKAFRHIFPENVLGGCPWQTSCLMWKKIYAGHWTDLRTTQDRVFEFHSACINNSVMHLPEKLCFVDKSTGENSADLVRYERSLSHRHFHTVYFMQNLEKIKHSQYNHQQMMHLLEKNLLKNTLRLVIYRHEPDKILQAFHLLFGKSRINFYTWFYLKPASVSNILNKLLVRLLQIELKFW